MPYVSSGQEIRIDLTGEDNLTPMLRDAASSMAVFTGSAERALYGLARIGAQAAPVLAVAAAFGIMAGQAATVQQNVANLNAVLQTTPNQLAAIRAQGLQLSQVTQFTDSQILLAQRQLAKGQQAPTAIMAETPSVLNLAGSTQSQPEQAGTVFIANQRVFQRGMADSADTANILATATDSSLESLIALGQGLKNVDPVAQAAGLGLKTTATAIADLSQQGLQGAQGGTALRTFLQHIERETPAARAEVEKLGLSFYDQAGQMRPLTEIMDQLRQKTAALTEEQRDAALTTIFGTRGALAAQVYAQQGSSGYNQTATDMSSLGTAAEINARKLDTLQGSLSKLGSSINVLEVQGGTMLLPFFKGAADGAEHFTNTLTSLNSHMSVLPQLAVAGAALFGESKLNTLLTNRRSSAAQNALDAAATARAPQQAYNEAIAQAEFTADAKIVAAHAEMDAALIRLDEERYNQWIALEAKTTGALDAADAKQLASLQTLTDRTLASIAEIDAAQAAATKANLDRQSLDFAKQGDLLAVKQRAATSTATVQRSYGSVSLGQQQEIERAQLAETQAVEAEYAAKYQEITDRSYAARRDNLIANAEMLAMEQERAGQMTRDAILANAEKDAATYGEAAAIEARAIEEANLKKITAAQAGYANVAGLGGAAMVGTGVQDIEGSAAARLALSTTVKQDMKVAAGNVALDAGFLASARGAIVPLVSKVGSALGPIGMGILVAATVKEMVINPIEKAVYDAASSKDPKLKSINIETSMALDPSGLDANMSQQRDFLLKAQKDTQAAIDYEKGQIEKYQPGTGLEKILTNTFGDDKNLGQAKVTLDGLNNDLSQIQGKLKAYDPNALKAIDENLKGNAAQDSASIINEFEQGRKTYDEARNALINAVTTDLLGVDPLNSNPGAKQQLIDDTVQASLRSLSQSKGAIETQARQDAQTYADNMDAAGKAAAAGASNDDILMGIFGVGPNGEDLTAQQVTQAKKHITDLEQVATTAATEVNAAWTEAQAAIGKIDPTKGIGSLVAAADNMKAAGDEMARLGLTNNEFSDLEKISLSFKDIADAEDRATAAFSGYLMEFNSTDDALSKLSAFQKQVVQAEKDAIAAKQAGTATPAQLQLADPKNQAAIAAYFRQQQQGLQGNEASSILGMVQGAPDFLSVDNANRQNVNALGGPQVLYSKLQLETTDAEAAIKLLLDDKHMKVTVDWQYPNGGPSILAANTQYGNATNDSGYNDQPPGSSGGGGENVRSLGQQNTPSSNLSYTPSGFNQFRQLDPGSYQKIVESGAGGPSTPFDDPVMYAAVMAAAKEYGVDPRALLAFTKNENGNATNISPELNAANNFGGIKYIGQKNASDSGIASPEGGDYAKFTNPTDFFRALAANLSTGQYQNMYNRGDLGAVRREYVVGGAGPGSPQQEKNIANTVSDYNSYVQKYPGAATPAFGGSSGFGSAAGAGSGPDAMLQAIFGTATSDIGQKSTVVDGITQSVYGWCEKIVDDLVQSATGQNVRFPTADAHVRAALAGDPRAGTVVSAANAQPGDLVGWTGDSSYAGNSAGHIGIYAGNGQYIGTTQDGVRQRAIGSGASTAVYIRPPGDTVVDPNNPDTGPGTQPGYGGSKAYANAYANGSTNAYGFNPINATGVNPNAPPYVDPTHYSDVTAGMAALDAFFKKMAAPDVGRIISQMGTDSSYFKNVYTRNVDPMNPSAMNAATDQANAANLTFGAAKAKAMFDALDPSKTDQFAADLKVVVATGGQIGQNAAQWLQYQRDINMATRETVQLQDQMKSAADQSFQRNRDRQDQDLLTAKTNLARDRKIQDDNFTMQIAFQSQERAIQADTNTENVSYTSTSRSEQDKQRNLQFSQQVQATDLQNKLADTQKAQQETIWQRTSAEQLVAANVKASGTNQGAAANAALLAGMHDQDLAQKDLNTKAIDNIQLQIREEARKANLDSFNLATETLQAQRAHEDAMQRLSDRSQKVAINQQNESNREQAQATKNQRDDQDHAIALAAIRLSQDRALEDWQRGAQKEIDLNATRTKTAQDGQSALDALLNDAISGMTTFGTTALGVVDSLNSAVGNAAAQGPNIGTSGAIRRLDGHWQGGRIPGFEGMSLVGEGPGGKILDSTEIISAPGSQVTPIAMLRALGLGGNTTTIGINAPITIGNVSDIVDVEETIDNALAPLRAQLRQAITKSRDYNTSIGIQRFGG